MGTLYIDRKGVHVKLDGNALAFYVAGEREGSAPVNPVDRVIVVGAATIDTPVLHRFANEGMSVLFLSGRSRSFSGMLHGRLHNNGLLRVRQYEKSLSSFSPGFALEMVTRKISAQKDLMGIAVEQRPDLRYPITTAFKRLTGALDHLATLPMAQGRGEPPDDEDVRPTLMGIEGAASAAYFSGYTALFAESLRFTNRNRRPPRDPVNAMLSLCYTMLHFEVVREIEVIGLDPTIGFYHEFDYGRESLACDLVEIYRAEADRFVWDLFREREFTARDFTDEMENGGCYLKKGGRKRFYPLYEEWAGSVRPKIVSEVRSLARRIMDGEDPLPE